MLLFRSLPNLADTPANRGFLRIYRSRWGKENCVLSVRGRQAAYAMLAQPLSVKAAWGGFVRFFLDGRAVAVDDDNYFITNDQRPYASALHCQETVHAVSIFFRPGLAQETLGALLTPEDRILDRGSEAVTRTVEFAEHLRPHDRVVTPLLRHIADQVDDGISDEMLFEELLSLLLERMLHSHRRSLAAIAPLDLARRATRREVLRRIGWSTDYLNTYYMRALTIGDLAQASSLSQFHFIRLFRAVHGVTPFAYLQKKRAAAARRLLMSTELGHDEIASRVGFACQSTMFRQLRRLTGEGGRRLRRNCKPP